MHFGIDDNDRAKIACCRTRRVIDRGVGMIDVQAACRILDSIPDASLARLVPQAVQRELCYVSRLAFDQLLCVASKEAKNLVYQLHQPPGSPRKI